MALYLRPFPEPKGYADSVASRPGTEARKETPPSPVNEEYTQLHLDAAAASIAGLKSAAVDALKREIGRYVKREIRGRSLLIAGHRGAGKTTSVLSALDALLQGENGDRIPRPLLVAIHGPDLFDVRRPSGAWELLLWSTADEKTGALAQHARLLIIHSLQRALCDEMARCFERCADLQTAQGRSRLPLLEVAAQFRLELDAEPDALRLRRYWEQLGRLTDGILRIDNPALPESERDRGQGNREIVALATALRVHHEILEQQEEERKDWRRTASGTHSQGESEPREEEGLGHYLRMMLAKGGHVLNPLAGLIVGVILVALLLRADVEFPISMIAGSIAAMGATLILNFATSRAEHYSLLAASTPDALNRMLPVMLARVRETGLHPVFVVDELDKLNQAKEKMDSLMNNLKHIASDQSMFCFLADRSYFEQISRVRNEPGYPKEETYFSDLIFVRHTAAELHTYLHDLVARGNGLSVQDIRNKSVFVYLSLYQSQMHIGALRRFLCSDLKDGQAGHLPEIAIHGGPLFSVRAYWFKVMIQLAVETILDDVEVKTRLRQTPDASQQLYDALYYPARRWENDAKALDAGRSSFKEDLKRRADVPETSLLYEDQLPYNKMLGIVAFLESPATLIDTILSRFSRTPLARRHNGAKAATILGNAWSTGRTLREYGSADSDDAAFAVYDAVEVLAAFANCFPARLRAALEPVVAPSPSSESGANEGETVTRAEEDGTGREGPDLPEPLLIQQGGSQCDYDWTYDRYGQKLRVDRERQVTEAIRRILNLEILVRDGTRNEMGLTDFELKLGIPSIKDGPKSPPELDLLLKERNREKILKYQDNVAANLAIIRAGFLLAFELGSTSAGPPLLAGLSSARLANLGLSNLNSSERLKRIQDELDRIRAEFAGDRKSPFSDPVLGNLGETMVLEAPDADLDLWVEAARIMVRYSAR